MVAPGKNLEFGESCYYTLKMESAPLLSNRIIEYLKSWPNSGTAICGGMREFEFSDELQVYAVIFARRGQILKLLDIFEIPEEALALESYREEARKIFCIDKQGRRS